MQAVACNEHDRASYLEWIDQGLGTVDQILTDLPDPLKGGVMPAPAKESKCDILWHTAGKCPCHGPLHTTSARESLRTGNVHRLEPDW